MVLLKWFSVPVFGVRVSVAFHLVFVHIILSSIGLLADHLLGKRCPFGLVYVPFAFCVLVILVISRYGFEGEI